MPSARAVAPNGANGRDGAQVSMGARIDQTLRFVEEVRGSARHWIGLMQRSAAAAHEKFAAPFPPAGLARYVHQERPRFVAVAVQLLDDNGESTVPAATQAPPLAELEARAKAVRRDIINSTTAAGSGHPTSSLSGVEATVALYFGGVLRYDPRNPHWPQRDRFILSKAMRRPLLYAVLAEAGFFPREMLLTLRQLGSPLEGHPNMRRLPGVEASTGSLGQACRSASAMPWRSGSTATIPAST